MARSTRTATASQGVQSVSDMVPAPHNTLYTAYDVKESQLLTTILRAGEALAEQVSRRDRADLIVSHATSLDEDESQALPEDFTSMIHIIEQIFALLKQDTRLSAQVAALAEAFGDGDPLRLLFRNLFPGQKRKQQLDPDGKRILSRREVEVLRHTYGASSQKAIAARLGISVETVNTHFRNIYKKLGVHKPMDAVTHAVAMGYLPWDSYELVLGKARHLMHGLSRFESFCANVAAVDPPLKGDEIKPLAAFGLLLLATSAAAAVKIDGDRDRPPSRRGLVCEMNMNGEVLQAFGAEYLGEARSIAIAPSHAARHGFTPGNLFVAHDLLPQRRLNRAAISEFSPGGEYIRTFCGGTTLRTRLVGPLDLAFAADGRLLETSGWMTDSILAFGEGGKTVQRFAEGCYWHLCISASGQIYVTQISPIGSIVKVFNSQGQLIQATGATSEEVQYHGIAISSCGHIFVGRFEQGRDTIERYDVEGNIVHSFAVPELSMGFFTIDAQYRLHAVCQPANAIKVLSLDGKVLRQIDLRGKIVPWGLTVGEGDRVWVCGRVG